MPRPRAASRRSKSRSSVSSPRVRRHLPPTPRRPPRSRRRRPRRERARPARRRPTGQPMHWSWRDRWLRQRWTDRHRQRPAATPPAPDAKSPPRRLRQASNPPRRSRGATAQRRHPQPRPSRRRPAARGSSGCPRPTQATQPPATRPRVRRLVRRSIRRISPPLRRPGQAARHHADHGMPARPLSFARGAATPRTGSPTSRGIPRRPRRPRYPGRGLAGRSPSPRCTSAACTSKSMRRHHPPRRRHRLRFGHRRRAQCATRGANHLR